jgi:methionyl-tRNA formyltransferase
VAEAQSRFGVSYAAKVQKSEAAIDWTQPAITIDRKVRAFAGWPVAESRLGDGRRLRIWAADIEDETPAPAAEPGTVLAADSRGILVATGHGALRITKLQPPGGRVMQARDWLAAHPLADARFVEQQ